MSEGRDATPPPAARRYLIGPRRAHDDAGRGDATTALRVVLEQLEHDPDVTFERLLGQRERPGLLVVTMSPARAARLQAQFPQLIIEPDAPLQPSDARSEKPR